jgi:exopolysaccharide biosynthesis polyprenyl glycosylphosphotransferase
MQSATSVDIPVVELPRSLWYRASKRAFDFVAAATLLVLLAPLLLVCAVLVWRSSPGPVIFRQRRVGARLREFTCYKFRTMVVNADPAIHQRYVTNFIKGQAEKHGTTHDAMFKLVGDQRITSIGRWLRRTSLDELPQLVNVVRGEMSLVGPRPPIMYEVEHYRPEQLQRLAVKPGITGLWQVSGRSRTTFEEMVALDLAYIRAASFVTDLRILLKTIPVVLSARDAH